MVKIIIQQENEDGTKTIAFKDSEGKTMISVITAKTPYVIDKQLVVKDKLKDTLNKITEEVSERMKILTLLRRGVWRLPIEEVSYQTKLDLITTEKHILVLEKIGLVERKEQLAGILFYAKGEEDER